MRVEQGMRDLPPGQTVKTRLQRLRLVPLCILAILSLVAAIAGAVVRVNESPLGEGVPQSTAEPAAGLDASCAPPFDAGIDGEPWTGDAAEASEAVWQQHVGEIGGYTMHGDDGHLLLGEDHWQNISQAVGRDVIDEEHVAAWYAYLNNMRADLEAVGTDLYIVVAPAKWQIMPEVLPDWAEDLRGSGNLDLLLEAHPELPWIDVRAGMQEAAAETPLYSPLNSHWSEYGAYVAFEQIATCLETNDPELAGLAAPELAGVGFDADINEFTVAGDMTEPGMDRSTPEYAEPLGDMELTLGGQTTTEPVETGIDMLELPATTENSAPAIDADALIIRDSTGTQIGPLFQDAFATTTQIMHSLDHPEDMPDVPAAAEEAGADVAFLVLTQRYLNLVPGVQP